MMRWLLLLMLVSACNRPTFRILEKPIPFDAEREALSIEYMKARHGLEAERAVIKPKIVVVHWTAIATLESSYDAFAPTRLRGRADLQGASALNVSAHFLIDRDGTIFRLLPDTVFARHTIGLNHAAIGIENIGSDKKPLTRKQLKANEALIRYLARKHKIEHVIGHHEYQSFRGHELWLETDPNYLTQKTDPGDRFMKRLRWRLRDVIGNR